MTAILNEQIARILVSSLIENDVVDFCLAPGSQCSSLAIAIAENPDAQTTVHFDERGLAFFALGIAKAKRKPVVIITTSGSAVAHLLPAVMEAQKERIPLLLLTADRSVELRASGGNQTIDQTSCLKPYLSWQIDLPAPTDDSLFSFYKRVITHALFSCKDGPVQINCAFRKPFFANASILEYNQKTTRYFSAQETCSEDALEAARSAISKATRGVIVVSGKHEKKELEAIDQLSQALDWPVFAEITARDYRFTKCVPYYEMQLERYPSPDCVLHFGARLIWKKLAQWIGSPTHYLHISSDKDWKNPSELTDPSAVTDYFCLSAQSFCRDLLLAKSTAHHYEMPNQESTHAYFSSAPFCEPTLFYNLAQNFPNDHALFIANSMPIRNANCCFFPDNPPVEIFANRGVSGIDGNIATACGIAQGLKKPVIALVGDQAALHDLNSLALLKSLPVLLVIINNSGGRIFNQLPIAKKSEIFDRFFANTHSWNFRHAAKMFSIPYHSTDNWEECATIIHKASGILELMTDSAIDKQVMENYDDSELLLPR